MPWKNLIGTRGESTVREWLTRKGFSLINFNWNCSYGEVDIIASLFDQLHFIAVATRQNSNGLPKEGITRKKMLSCRQAAQQYLERHPRWKHIIFDVLAVQQGEEAAGDIVLISDIKTV